MLAIVTRGKPFHPYLFNTLYYLSQFPTCYTQFFIYLHITHLLKSSTCFEHYPAHLQEVYVVTVYICSLWYRHCLQATVLCTGLPVYLHITHLLKSSTCFEHYPAHLQEVYVVTIYMQPLALSLSAGDCPVHRLRKNSSFLTGALDSHLHRVTIPEAAYIQL